MPPSGSCCRSHRSTRKTVRQNVEGLGDIKVKLDRFNEVAELMATDYTDELMEEVGRLGGA